MTRFPNPETITVGVADDHPLMRRGLQRLLEEAADIDVIATASDGVDVLELVEQRGIRPDVFVLDLRMPRLGGVETTRRLHEIGADVRVVIISGSEDARAISDAVGAGASAFVLKSAEGEEFLAAIRMVARGHAVLHAGTLEAFRGDAALPASTTVHLSRREREVLELLARGLSNRQMAEELGLSFETVKTHVERLYRKLGVSRRVDAVGKGLRVGLID